MTERDPFWESRREDVEAAKQPWTWPRAAAVIGCTLVFWTAICVVAYLIVTND